MLPEAVPPVGTKLFLPAPPLRPTLAGIEQSKLLNPAEEELPSLQLRVTDGVKFELSMNDVLGQLTLQLLT
jgi:hypothetical protein